MVNRVCSIIYLSLILFFAGDLLENLQDFAQKAGMKEDMVDLITQSEGTFRLVRKRQYFLRRINL